MEFITGTLADVLVCLIQAQIPFTVVPYAIIPFILTFVVTFLLCVLYILYIFFLFINKRILFYGLVNLLKNV